MKKLIFFTFLSFLGHIIVFAQQKLPVIRATSRVADLREGNYLQKGAWYIEPAIKPDIVYVGLPRKAQRVTLITDIDSISFDVKYGQRYDFIVLLNSKDSCYSQIAGVLPNLKSYEGGTHTSDTIPFTLRRNRIYFEGKINDSGPLSIQFDLGAGMSNINYKSVKKIQMDFDNKATLVNSDGQNEARLSNKNKVHLGPFTWQNDAFVETKNMENWEDAIVGNGLFLDKIIEIDYDKKLFVIHEKLPLTLTGYQKIPMILEGGIRPLIEASIEIEGKKYTDWFLFDTGFSGNGVISDEMTLKHNIYGKFRKLLGNKKAIGAFIPKILIGDYAIEKGIIGLERPHGNYKSVSLIGNKILKKFNVLMDNQQGFMYLKPNGLAK